ncbi:MAG: hypothetical protein HYZ16_01515 [Bacteroidetes bacterium]|nr:hypothetical protein [Bacteroidota bacterium]
MYLLTACTSGMVGESHDNLPPETYTVAKHINRVGDQRFVSQVSIQWWGDDPDGAVSGYEFSIDQVNWTYTKKQDSVFLVNLPEGLDTFDFAIYIRAIDNYGLADPSPAHVVYPVKNSPPHIAFSAVLGSPTEPARQPRKSFPIIQYRWEVDDPDGYDNIDYVEFFINDTTAKGMRIGSDYQSLTLEAIRPEEATSPVRIYVGSTMVLLDGQLDGLRLDAMNKFYLRATDKVGAQSGFAVSKAVYVKRKVGNVLLVNAYANSISERELFYLSHLQAVGIAGIDTMRVNEVEGGYYTQLAADNATQSLIFSLFDVLVWFGEDAGYTLTLAQRTTPGFIAQGGRMFVSVFFSSGIDPLSTYLEFTPIDSLVDPKGGVFFMDKNAAASPSLAGWPTISSSKIITSPRPFYPSFGAQALYAAQLKTPAGEWVGESTIMAKTEAGGHTRFVISSIELHRLDGNGNMMELFQKIFKEEFGL